MSSEPTLTPAAFAARWRDVTTTEKASAQSHFTDLCRMLGEPTPHESDPTGESYAFEKALTKTTGGGGFADVWKRGFFGWEYKGKHHDLKAAYRQLLDYREALENPPLLVVCDLERIEVHTNFTGLSPVTRVVTLDDLASPDPSTALAILRAVFTAPEELRPTYEPAQITEKAARHFAELAQALRARGHDPQQVAHFLDRILFCLFAEDAGLLPKSLFSRLAKAAHGRSDRFAEGLADLFEKMSAAGGMFGAEEIEWFNGGLFDSSDVLPLTGTEIETLLQLGHMNWALIEPAIFGTLFERGLDPDQRAQLGAHYTDRTAIWELVEPVVIRPLRREYAEMQARVTELVLKDRKITKATPADQNPNAIFEAFLDRLRKVRVLDPACGSGNFLFVTLWALKDLEFEAINWGSLVLKRPMQLPQIGPEAVLGIELNAYAAELARVTIWIGEIQWMIRHGLGYRRNPILRPLHHIETRDALIDWTDPTHPTEAAWPPAEFIVGNPPFLGGSLMRSGLGDEYTEAVWDTFEGRLPRTSDFCCYWHEKARAQIASGQARRAGLLATQGIRGQQNRRVLERVNESGAIFFGKSDEPWILSGANVHISFVGQDDGLEPDHELDGRRVAAINANLTNGIDLTKASRLEENQGIAFEGDKKGGPFEIPGDLAVQLLGMHNPDGRTNSEVIRRWVNGLDIGGRDRGMYIIDFGPDRSEADAALYEAPFEYLRMTIRPELAGAEGRLVRSKWWLHERPRPELRKAVAGLRRVIVTIRHSKHRLFTWIPGDWLADSALVVVARDDDYAMGVLHSRAHEVWARATGTQVREVESGFRYTPTTTFDTYPFPEPPADLRIAIAAAACELIELRDGWLNPSGASADEVARRTLTSLYNNPPTWLSLAHERLNRAVLDAYGWPSRIEDEEMLDRLLTLNNSYGTASEPNTLVGA